MNKYDKETMDRIASEAFAADDMEKNIDLGFDPADVVAGDPEAMAEFKRLHAGA